MKRMFLSSVLGLALLAGSSLLVACEANPPQQQARSGSASLQMEDETIGTGATAQAGRTVTVHYTGTLAENGQKFDSSRDHGRPFSFRLGAGQVIEGWDQGLLGMKEGGKRVLVIPPEQAYGSRGVPPVIPPNATLRFEVELLSVE